MTRFRGFYIITMLLALLLAFILITCLFPSELYLKLVLVATLPALIIAIGFRIITLQRIKTFRNQLYQILQTLEEFDVDEPTKVAFQESPFPIFNELNVYLVELAERIRTNYQSNKQFTQNAAHELQTPLAIIKGHIELLINSPNLGEKEMNSLGIVLQNTNRLSKLNSTLILLSKIEHQRFIDTEPVDFTKLTDEILENFHDLIQLHGISITKEYKGIFTANMSHTLAEILIANLVQNAIRHNIDAGHIAIQIDTTQFIISNPGKVLEVPTAVLFKRFKRVSDLDESLGLGLSIIKRISEQADLSISYENIGTKHILSLKKV